MVMPFGMYFIENSSDSDADDKLPIYYDESRDYSIIYNNEGTIPFVESSLAYLSTVIITRKQGDKPEDDEDGGDMWRAVGSWLNTVTVTKTNGEGPQDDDNYEWQAHSRLMTVTVTENRGEGPQDDDGDDGEVGW